MTAPPDVCDPNWRDPDPDPDDTPTPGLCRVHEIADMRGQQASPRALWTAHDIPTQEYL